MNSSERAAVTAVLRGSYTESFHEEPIRRLVAALADRLAAEPPGSVLRAVERSADELGKLPSFADVRKRLPERAGHDAKIAAMYQRAESLLAEHDVRLLSIGSVESGSDHTCARCQRNYPHCPPGLLHHKHIGEDIANTDLLRGCWNFDWRAGKDTEEAGASSVTDMACLLASRRAGDDPRGKRTDAEDPILTERVRGLRDALAKKWGSRPTQRA